MKHLARRLPMFLAMCLPIACDSGTQTLDDAELARVVALCKAEVLADITHGRGSGLGRLGPATANHPTLSDSERAAIAAARARQAQPTAPDAPPLPGDPPPTVAGLPESPPKTNGLTGDDLAAAADDPAARGTDFVADGAVPAEVVPAAPDGEEIRPGTRLYAATGEVSLIDLAVATEIKDRLPQNVNPSYNTMPETLFCYSVFANPTPSATVTHVWRRGQRLVSRVELEVGKSTKWRTWSRQRTRPKWTGPWSCEVLDPEGQRIGLVTFSIDL